MTQRLTPFEIMTQARELSHRQPRQQSAAGRLGRGLSGEHGITAHRHYDETGEKAALFAHVGPEVAGGVVLSGHTDVVPVDGQPWASDPFTVVERDGKYFGRGCVDMKGFDALAIWTLVEAHHAGVARPLQLALSYDEEVGCIGAPPMIEQMLAYLPKADMAIIGEPSMMQAVTGQKGGLGFDVHVVGFEVHSSMMHRGVNAIMAAAPLIDWANQRNAENRARTPSEWRRGSSRPGRRCMWARSRAAPRITSPPRIAGSAWISASCPARTPRSGARGSRRAWPRSRPTCRPCIPTRGSTVGPKFRVPGCAARRGRRG